LKFKKEHPTRKKIKLRISGVDLSPPLLLLQSSPAEDDEQVAYSLISAGALLASIFSRFML